MLKNQGISSSCFCLQRLKLKGKQAKMIKNKVEFKSVIDTIAIRTDINNVEDFTRVNNENYEYINKLYDSFDNSQMTLKVNLHTKFGEMVLDNVKKYNSALNSSLAELGVLNLNEVELNRIDIALDTNDYTMQKDFKKMLFAYELLTIKHKKSDRWYTTNLNTLERNTIKLYDSRFELEIYNKAKVSNNMHPYQTRIEFRYKRLNKDLKESDVYLDKVAEKVKEMDGKLLQLEDNMSKRLIKLYQADKDNVKSFSEFVRKYNDYFYTLNILKNVYKESGMRGSYKNWLDTFRKTNTLEFYTAKDIKELQKAMIKSVKSYMKQSANKHSFFNAKNDLKQYKYYRFRYIF